MITKNGDGSHVIRSGVHKRRSIPVNIKDLYNLKHNCPRFTPCLIFFDQIRTFTPFFIAHQCVCDGCFNLLLFETYKF